MYVDHKPAICRSRARQTSVDYAVDSYQIIVQCFLKRLGPDDEERVCVNALSCEALLWLSVADSEQVAKPGLAENHDQLQTQVALTGLLYENNLLGMVTLDQMNCDPSKGNRLCTILQAMQSRKAPSHQSHETPNRCKIFFS
eukprot:2145057-Amphidinium_carterae.4